MRYARTLLSFIDTHIVLILAAVVLTFIPLFPKIPLFDILPGYIVRVRIEDFLILFTGVVWLIQLLRKKITLNTPVLFFVILYSLVGLASLVLGIVLTHSIPPYSIHIGKSLLHFFRYLEYFSLFFFTYSAIRSKKDLQIILGVLTATVIAIALYGAGQKYLGWPLFSTMNREYSKGEALYLTEFARVQSTFAGHYDLTAYLVLVLPILLALLLYTKNKKAGIVLAGAQLAGLWLLIVGASKGSLVAYGLTQALVIYHTLHTNYQPVARAVRWIAIAGISVCIAAGVAATTFPHFFVQAANATKPIAPLYTALVKVSSFLPENSPLNLAETTAEPDSTKPKDVYGTDHDSERIAVTSATGETTFITVARESTWSPNALKYGLSMGIRLDTLWPQALQGFVRNPLTGSGYATLNKGDSSVYTEADSTDNNFLRVIGETGLLGFFVFFGLLYFLGKQALQYTKLPDPTLKALAVGYLAGSFGLLINALTIDVFAASKVAFTFWGVSGLTLAVGTVISAEKTAQAHQEFFKTLQAWISKHGLFMCASSIFFFNIYQNPFTEKSAILNFAHNLAGAEQVSAARCLLTKQSFSFCAQNYPSESFLVDAYRIGIAGMLALYNNPGMYFIFNLTATAVVVYGTYLVLQRYVKNKYLAGALMLLVYSTFKTFDSTAIAQPTLQPLLLAGLLAAFGVLFSRVNAKEDTPWHTIYRLTPKVLLAASSSIFILTFLSASRLEAVQENFRSSHSHWRYAAVQHLNSFFYSKKVGATATLSPEVMPRVITATSPHYISLFTTGMYAPIPLEVLSEATGTDSYSVYSELLAEHPLYLSTSDIDPKTNAAFKDLSRAFSLSLQSMACDYRCQIYSVSEKKTPERRVPSSVVGSPLEPTFQNLTAFSIISNRFEENEATIPQLAALYAKTATGTAFSLVTGDLLPRYDQEQFAALKQAYQATGTTVPLLFSAGNFDRIPSKQPVTQTTSFFTDEEYFLFVTPTETGGLSESQQLALINATLEIESIPTITTVFVITHQTNWVGYHVELQPASELTLSRSPLRTDSFMVTQLLPRLAALENTQVYVVSGDRDPRAQQQSYTHHLPETNLTFLLSGNTDTATTGNYFSFVKESTGRWNYSVLPR